LLRDEIQKGDKCFQRPRQVTFPIFKIEPLKYSYRIGLETLVVYTMNLWVLYGKQITLLCQLTRKYLTWGVKLQR